MKTTIAINLIRFIRGNNDDHDITNGGTIGKISVISSKKMENLSKTKIIHKLTKSGFVKTKISSTDFLISKTKITFFSLQKTFIKVLIPYHFTIDEVPSWLTLDQSLLEYMISRNKKFFESDISE